MQVFPVHFYLFSNVFFNTEFHGVFHGVSLRCFLILDLQCYSINTPCNTVVNTYTSISCLSLLYFCLLSFSFCLFPFVFCLPTSDFRLPTSDFCLLFLIPVPGTLHYYAVPLIPIAWLREFWYHIFIAFWYRLFLFNITINIFCEKESI